MLKLYFSASESICHKSLNFQIILDISIIFTNNLIDNVIWATAYFQLKIFPCDFNVHNSSSANYSVIHLMLIQAHIKFSSQNSKHFSIVTVYCLHLSFTHIFVIVNRQIIATISSHVYR